MLILSRKLNEKIILGGDIEISIIEIRGDQVKIGVKAPRSVPVFRKEVFDAIQAENRAAALSASSSAAPGTSSDIRQPDLPDLGLPKRGQ